MEAKSWLFRLVSKKNDNSLGLQQLIDKIDLKASISNLIIDFSGLCAVHRTYHQPFHFIILSSAFLPAVCTWPQYDKNMLL